MRFVVVYAFVEQILCEAGGATIYSSTQEGRARIAYLCGAWRLWWCVGFEGRYVVWVGCGGGGGGGGVVRRRGKRGKKTSKKRITLSFWLPRSLSF